MGWDGIGRGSINALRCKVQVEARGGMYTPPNTLTPSHHVKY